LYFNIKVCFMLRCARMGMKIYDANGNKSSA
jgi:hypothetical protein